MTDSLTEDKLVDHNEAWSLANFKYENSNLARCYVEAHNLIREIYNKVPVTALPNETAHKVERIARAVRVIMRLAPRSETPDIRTLLRVARERLQGWSGGAGPDGKLITEIDAYLGNTQETPARPYTEVMKQAEREGVDAQDLISTLMKKVEDQRRELARLNVEHRTAVGTRVPVTDRRVESAISEEGVPLCSTLKASERCFKAVHPTTFPCVLPKGHDGPHSFSENGNLTP